MENKNPKIIPQCQISNQHTIVNNRCVTCGKSGGEISKVDTNMSAYFNLYQSGNPV